MSLCLWVDFPYYLRPCFSSENQMAKLRSFSFMLESINVSKTLACSLVTSRLDYGNTLLDGLSSKSLSRLQRIQNTAARIITRKKKHDHITPVTMPLRWVTVKFWIKYKLLVTLLRRFKGRHHRTYRIWQIYMFVCEHCIPKIQVILSNLVFAQINMVIGG